MRMYIAVQVLLAGTAILVLVAPTAAHDTTSASPQVCFGKRKNSCRKKGGDCVTAPFKSTCISLMGPGGRLNKNECRGKDCQCCLPPICSKKIKKSCSDNGGTCVAKPFKSNCAGGTLDPKGCKGKNCQCCIIDPTTAEPTTAEWTLITHDCIFSSGKTPPDWTTTGSIQDSHKYGGYKSK